MINLFGFKFSYRLIALSYAALGVFALAMALTAEHVFGLLPCKLCLIQRWPYGLMIGVGILGILFHKNKTVFNLLLFIIVGLFAYGAYYGVYQTGGEQGWWQLTSDCSSVIDPTLSPDEYLKALKNAPTVPCDKPAWTLFGISMAGYNAMFSSFMVLFTLFLAVKVFVTKE